MSTTTTLLLWMPLLLSLSEVRCEIGELQGQVKITYQLLYASSTYLEELYNSDKKRKQTYNCVQILMLLGQLGEIRVTLFC